MKRLLLALTLFLAPFVALAQSSPGLQYGQVPTAGQWNSYFAAKQDYSASLLTGSGVSGHVAKFSGVAGLLQDGGILPIGANPSSVAGLSAVNGVASSYMRSDGAPAISQAITPTWSGVHTFTLAPVFTAQSGTRTALGLGTAATVNTGTSGATIPLLNGANTYSGASIFSSTLAPNGGLVGVTTNSNAAAGQVGELIPSTVLVGSAVSMTTSTPVNITSISLTAGDWDVWGNVAFAPAGTTTVSLIAGWISTTSAAIPTAPNEGAMSQLLLTFQTGQTQIVPIGMKRISLAGTTTIYLSAVSGFAISTMQGYGYIGARRVR